MVQVSDLLHSVVIVHGLVLLVEVLMRHDLMVATKRLHYLLSILVDNDRLAEVAATFIS